MRCASPVTFYAYTTATGSTRVGVEGLTVTEEGSTCTGSQYVVLTQIELDAATVSPFRLDLDQAAAISGAVLAVWAVGWAIRTLVRVLRHTDNVSEVES